MKKVLLIIAYSLVTTTNHCAAAAAAAAADDQNPRALALLAGANSRENPFLGNPPPLPEPALRKSQSDSCLARRRLKRIKGMNDLSSPYRDTSPTDKFFSDDDDDDQRSPSLTQRPFNPSPQPDLLALAPTPQPTALADEPLKITSCLGELFAAHRAVHPFLNLRRIVPASVLPVAGWFALRAPLAQKFLPGFFTRSGPSPIVTYSLAIVTGAAGLWVVKDRILAQVYTRAAIDNLRLTQRELATMQQQITALQAMQCASEQKLTDMEKALETAKTNAVNAREGIERLLTNVQALVAQITGDLGNAVHIQEVTVLKDRVTALEDLLKEIVLTQDQAAAAQGPNLDVLTRQANELAEAAKHFARMDDHAENKKFAQQVVEEKRKEEEQEKRHWWNRKKK